MNYTIGEVAKKLGLSTYTLRYYDKEGLLPFIKRTEGGIRIFSEQDLDFLLVINCLKNTGMSIADIRKYIQWADEGDSSLQKRYDLFREQKKAIEQQIQHLKTYLECIEYKCNYYEKALAAGTEAIYKNNPNMNEQKMPLKKIISINEENK